VVEVAEAEVEEDMVVVAIREMKVHQIVW